VCIADLLDVSRKEMVYSWQVLRPIATLPRPDGDGGGDGGGVGGVGDGGGGGGDGGEEEEEDDEEEAVVEEVVEEVRVLVGMHYVVPHMDHPVHGESDANVVFER
tara:strand:- start:345 stop:659 length:315 start_codon:yes stop_codon:yes gene_type:complete